MTYFNAITCVVGVGVGVWHWHVSDTGHIFDEINENV
jgi:hypothetical protein